MNEISLVIQSVCLEAAVGLVLFLALGRLKSKDINGKTVSIIASVLAVIGVASSITHLGKPLRAFNSLLNLGSSWMSRETLLVMLFTGCCVLCLIVNLWKPAMKSVVYALEWASAITGLALLYVMGSIYTFASVPSWEGANTYIEFYTSAIMLGATLYFALTVKQQDRGDNKVMGAVVLAALAVQIISSELHTAALGAGSAAAAKSLRMLSDNGTLVAVKWALLVIGAGVFCLLGIRKTASRLAAVTAVGSAADEAAAQAGGSQAAWISVCAVFAAGFIGKVLFFTTMVTTGIGM